MSPLSLTVLLWLNDKTLETCKVDKPTCAQVCGSFPELDACKGVSPDTPEGDIAFFVQMIMNLIAQANEPESSAEYQQARVAIPQLVWPRRSLPVAPSKKIAEAHGTVGFGEADKPQSFDTGEVNMAKMVNMVTPGDMTTLATLKPIPQGSMVVPSLDSKPQSEVQRSKVSSQVDTDILLGERGGGYSFTPSFEEEKEPLKEILGLKGVKPKSLDLKRYLLPKRSIAGVSGPGVNIFERISDRYRTECKLERLLDCK